MNDAYNKVLNAINQRQKDIWPSLKDNFRYFSAISKLALKSCQVDHRVDFFLDVNAFEDEFNRLIKVGFNPESAAKRLEEQLRDLLADSLVGLGINFDLSIEKFNQIKKQRPTKPKRLNKSDRVYEDYTALLKAYNLSLIHI